MSELVIASVLVCTRHLARTVCRMPVATGIAVGVVLAAFAVLLAVNTLATVSRAR